MYWIHNFGLKNVRVTVQTKLLHYWSLDRRLYSTLWDVLSKSCDTDLALGLAHLPWADAGARVAVCVCRAGGGGCWMVGECVMADFRSTDGWGGRLGGLAELQPARQCYIQRGKGDLNERVINYQLSFPHTSHICSYTKILGWAHAHILVGSCTCSITYCINCYAPSTLKTIYMYNTCI